MAYLDKKILSRKLFFFMFIMTANALLKAKLAARIIKSVRRYKNDRAAYISFACNGYYTQ